MGIVKSLDTPTTDLGPLASGPHKSFSVTPADLEDRAEVHLDGLSRLSASDIYRVASGRAVIIPELDMLARAEASAAHASAAMNSGAPIYGITTGFGPLADAGQFPNSDETIQHRLIYHLASGVGEAFDYVTARAIVAHRLVVLSRCASGVPAQLLVTLADTLNKGLAPVIPNKGTVGASGDLTPSAHLALALRGEGAWFTRDGSVLEGDDAFKRADIPKLTLTGRTNLALVNGVSAMTGIAALIAAKLPATLTHALSSAAAAADCMGARREAYAPRFAEIRPHSGQIKITRALDALLHDSAWLKNQLFEESRDALADSRMQDPYSLRCLPQAFGAIVDFLAPAMTAIDTEINSVSDNPVLDQNDTHFLHGGNFYGQHIAFAGDTISQMLTKLAVILDRQLDLMCDTRRSGGLPPFLCRGTPGIDSGLMGAQVTATALMTEMRSRLGNISTLGMPTNGHNQDINTMGTVAVRQAAEQLSDLQHILAIHQIAVAEAFDLRIQNGRAHGAASSTSRLVEQVRRYVAPILEDRPLAGDIKTLADHLPTAPLQIQPLMGAIR